jgi:hypothetical protein
MGWGPRGSCPPCNNAPQAWGPPQQLQVQVEPSLLPLSLEESKVAPPADWSVGVWGERGAHGFVAAVPRHRATGSASAATGTHSAAAAATGKAAAPATSTTRSGHSRIREAIAIGIAIAVGRLGCCGTSNAHGEGHHQKSGGGGHGCSVVCGLRSLKVETADFDWLLVSSRFQLKRTTRTKTRTSRKSSRLPGVF